MSGLPVNQTPNDIEAVHDGSPPLVASPPLPPSLAIASPLETRGLEEVILSPETMPDKPGADELGGRATEVDADRAARSYLTLPETDETAKILFEDGEGNQSMPEPEAEIAHTNREAEQMERIQSSVPPTLLSKAPPSRIPRSPTPSPPPDMTIASAALASPSYDVKAESESPQLTMPPRALLATPSPSTRDAASSSRRYEPSTGGKSIGSSGGSGDRPPWKIPGKATGDLFGSTLPVVGGSGRWKKEEGGRWEGQVRGPAAGGSRSVSQAGRGASEEDERPPWKRPGTGGGAS